MQQLFAIAKCLAVAAVNIGVTFGAPLQITLEFQVELHMVRLRFWPTNRCLSFTCIAEGVDVPVIQKWHVVSRGHRISTVLRTGVRTLRGAVEANTRGSPSLAITKGTSMNVKRKDTYPVSIIGSTRCVSLAAQRVCCYLGT
jgi:hypothetical protein